MTTIDPGPDMADRGTATADLGPDMADPRAVADLLRISEPGDRLLRAAVATSGAEPLRGLLDGPRTALAAADRPGVGTIAFMAGGVDRFYPRGNAGLLTAVARTGVVISEAAPGSTAMRHRFLMRNRLIAATAAATVVVQAGWRSGALNTANRAAELLRPVGAVPGPVTAHDSAGCHRLIREGAAVCVTTADEVRELVESLTELSAEAAGTSAGDQQGRLRITDDLTEEQARIYSALPPRRGTEVAALASRAGLEVPAAMGALAVLELAGLAERRDHGWVKLRTS